MRLLDGEKPLEGVRKLAVLRANGIGDLVFALPALAALRASYPGAEIVLLGREWHRDFLAGRHLVDRVVSVPDFEGPEDDLERDRRLSPFLAAMRSEAFDIGIQIHGGGRHSNPLIKGIDARLTVGLQAPDAQPLDLCVPYVYFQSEVMRFLEVVSLIGAGPVELEPRLPLTHRDLEEAAAVVGPSERPLAALHPGASDTRRRWPVEKFAATGDVLARAGARVIVLGADEDVPLAGRVGDLMKEECSILAGRLSLSGLAGILSRCSVFVGNDSGCLHLAAAVGAPAVGVFWCGNLITAGGFTRSRYRPVLSWRLNCSVCGVNALQTSCEHRASFVADVPVSDVAGEALALLRQQPRPVPSRLLGRPEA